MSKTTLLALLFLTACPSADVNKARKEARSFAQSISGATDVVCNDSDSDHDGYVSCTVFRGDKDPIALSCGAENYCTCNCASGCKLVPFAGGAARVRD